MKQYRHVAFIPSKTTDKEHEIKTDENNVLSCGCKGWIFRHGRDENGHCKHIREYLANGGSTPGPMKAAEVMGAGLKEISNIKCRASGRFADSIMNNA